MRLFQTMEVLVEAIECGLQSGQLKCIAGIDDPFAMKQSVHLAQKKLQIELGCCISTSA
jgi:hypothetical protein